MPFGTYAEWGGHEVQECTPYRKGCADCYDCCRVLVTQKGKTGSFCLAHMSPALLSLACDSCCETPDEGQASASHHTCIGEPTALAYRYQQPVPRVAHVLCHVVNDKWEGLLTILSQ